jgi:hypothetical protein
MVGLTDRSRTGRGRFIETSMLASAAYAASNDLTLYEGRREAPRPDSRQLGLTATYRLFQCKSGWLFLAAAKESEWLALVRRLGQLGDIVAGIDPQEALRAPVDGALGRELEGAFLQETATVWVDELRRLGVPLAVADRAPFEESLRQRKFLSPDQHPGFGPYWRLGPRVSFGRMPTARRRADAPGGSTVEILGELGFSKERIQRWLASDIVREWGG